MRIIPIIVFFLTSISTIAQIPKWITANDSLSNAPNTWIEFKKDFNLTSIPKSVAAKIAADTKYWLWINDCLVTFEGGLKRGPNPADTYFDSVNIKNHLKKGHNSIRILLWHFGKPGFSHVNSGKAGLIFDAQSIGIASDSSWLSQRLKAFGSACNPAPNFRLAESNIRYDARLSNQADFMPSAEIGVWGSEPWNRLAERPIPAWRDYGVKFGDVKESTDNRGNKVLTVKLPYNMQLTPVIKLYDSTGGTLLRLETDHVRGGSQDCIRAEYITRRGEQEYESLGWMNGEELRVIYPDSANIEIEAIGYRETGYDAGFEGHFNCSDSTVNRFWSKAMRTLYVNMRDTYFDCPDRERAQWWGDVTILMGQSFYQLSPKANALMRKAIYELVDWQKPDGTLFSPIPAENWDKELPAQMLAAISTYGFWYYYMHTGDVETMKHAYPAMHKYLSLWELDADGLTRQREGGWAWGDWGKNIDTRLLLAAWHHMALQSAVKIANLTGNDSDIEGYQSRMDSIKTAFNKCWNGYAYRHPSYHDITDDRVQALAILSGIADPAKHKAIMTLFHSIEQASPYMEKYVLEAMVKCGEGEYALQRFKKRFGPMIEDPAHTTLYEGWSEGGYGGGSTNHAWSGGMLTVIAEQVCGVRPTAAAWKEFEVCPNPIIDTCEIEIPTVKGLVKSFFTDSDASFILHLSIPDGTVANVSLPHNNYKSIAINGKRADKKQLKNLKKGTYAIVCAK